MTYKKITIWTIFINFVWTFEQFLWILYGFIWNVNFKIFEPVYHAFISPLISYSNVNQITFRRPIKFFTTHRLNCGSNMATIMFEPIMHQNISKTPKKVYHLYNL